MSERSHTRGPDGATLGLLTIACFLAVLALLGTQISAPAARKPPRTALVRRVYRTTIDETVIGDGARSPSSSTSESRSLGPSSAEPAPVGTRTS